MSVEDLESLLKEGFSELEYKRRIVENNVGFFETVPLDDSLWISVRLKESAATLSEHLTQAYKNAAPPSTSTMKTSFYDQRVHSFLPRNKNLRFIIMNSAPT
jgi:hypothetical protein